MLWQANQVKAKTIFRLVSYRNSLKVSCRQFTELRSTRMPLFDEPFLFLPQCILKENFSKFLDKNPQPHPYFL